jgi:hypothetical protein
VDGNQAAIVKALRAVGASVEPLHRVGAGCPDLLVGYRRKNLLLEVKDGPKAPMTGDQVEWHETWRGQVAVVRSVDDALAAIRETGGEA